MTDTVCSFSTDTELQLYAYDEMPSPASERLGAHIDGCVDCQGVVEEFRDLRARSREVTNRAAITDLWPGVLARYTTEERTESRSRAGLPMRRWRGRAFRLLTTVAAAAALVVAVMLARRDRSIPVAQQARDTATSPAQAAPPTDQALVLARPSIETLDRALEEVDRAAAKAPGDPYLKRLLTRTRRDRAAFASQVSAMADGAK